MADGRDIHKFAQTACYILLGVDYGSDQEVARRAFVQKVRAIRQLSDPPISEEVATEALHTIEQVILDPERAVDVFRVPANADLLAIKEVGLFNPQPVPLERRAQPISDDDLVKLAEAELERLIDVALVPLLSDEERSKDNPYQTNVEH